MIGSMTGGATNGSERLAGAREGGTETERQVPSRHAEVAANLADQRRRIGGACAAAGRDPSEVTLIAVTKARPAADIRLLAELGVRDIGENRDQEAAPKVRQCADLEVTWHFVGQLQTNKCRSVASYASVVHSVDRTRLVSALGAEARRAGRVVHCLVQVDLEERSGQRSGQGGVAPAEVCRMGGEIARTEGLRLAGVMAMAPGRGDPGPAFARLAKAAEHLRERYPEATVVSAGMSSDVESAIAHGATHVRIGTALLGPRRAEVG